MTTKCYSMVRGSALRITELTKRGGFNREVLRYGVSKTVATVRINEITEPQSDELIRNDEEEPRLRIHGTTDLIRYTVDIDFLRCDPGILHLVTGVPLAYNDAGDVVGFDMDTRLPVKTFALEVWSRLLGEACSADVIESAGFGEGDFGAMIFGDGDEGKPADVRQWGRTIMPFLKGGYVSGFIFTNDGKVTFNLRNAKANRSPRWGLGPYGDDPFMDPVSRNLMVRNYISLVQPPAQTDGIQEILEPVVDNGDALDPGTGILDGEFVVTSPDIVDGGGAS